MIVADPQRLAADPRASAFVSANAGAGKTTTLVSRVARLLLAGAEPSAILCVTYTKAAAAEMQRRLFQRLGSWAVMPDAKLAQALAELGEPGQELPRARKLFAQALETPGGLKIQTVHAFCERLLRRFPLEAGIAPGFRVMEDAAAAETAAAARARIAGMAMAGTNGFLSDAYARFAVQLAFDDFEAMFTAFESQREPIADFVAEHGGLAGLPDAVRELCELDELRDAEAVETGAVLPPALDPSRWLRAAAALAQGTEKTDQPRGRLCQAVAEAALSGVPMLETAKEIFFTGTGQPRANLATKGVDGAVADWLREEQARLQAAFEEARAQRVADDTLNALVLGAWYAQAYAEEKAERGALDFADLIDRSKALLAERPDAAWVLYKLDGGIDHLLIDEAQDTAPDQWAIVRQLTADFFSGDAGTGRRLERTIFAVGDEKQSIFSFQGAAPEYLKRETLYYQGLVLAAERGFHDLRMIDSWRSAPEVLAYVDGAFQPPELLQGLLARTALADEDLLKHIAKRADHGGVVDLWPLEREEEAAERPAWDAPVDIAVAGNAWRRLAEKIAAEIKAMVTRGEAVHDHRDRTKMRPVGYGDILILVRKRKRMFDELLRALRRQGVPVAGADRLALAEHIAFDDLLALGRFVLFPTDDLSLAALLRSPFCDLDEQALFDLIQPREGKLWPALTEKAQTTPALNAAHRFLDWALRAGRDRPPFEFYGRVMSRLDEQGRSMRARFATRLGSEALDAADEFLAEALNAEQRGVRELEGFVDALSRLKLVVKREMDEPRGEVRIMTAHGAKGLEAPVVFLPETVGAGGGRGSPLLAVEGGGFLWCGSEKNDCPASRLARERRKKKGEDEALRLLYVALTRARDRLIVAGRVNATAKEENIKGWWAPLCAAFERLPVRETASASGLTVKRYGKDPQLLGPGAAEPAQAFVVPGWALRPAPPEPPALRYAAPSTLAEAGKGPAPSPLILAGGLGRFRRGLLVHRLLELLPDLPPAAWEDAARRLLDKERDLTPAQKAEIAGAALAVLRDPRFAEVFGPGSRAEAAVAGKAAGLPEGLAISGRVDRMLITPDRILVADFKSNRPAPASVEATDEAYLTQMAVYVAVLREAFPGRAVEAALVWTDGPALMPIPEHVIAQRLAALKVNS